jgi:SAM-dependent methyltransferase
VTLGATRAVDGHRLIPSELQPTPLLAFVEAPRGGDGVVFGAEPFVVSGWAVSLRGRSVQGLLRLGDSTERVFACDEVRPEVTGRLDLADAGVGCGFRVEVALPDGVDFLSARLELSDGELIADAAPFRIVRRTPPQLRREAPTPSAPMSIFAGEWRTIASEADPSATDDERIVRGVAALDGVDGARVLDVGAGEGRSCVVLERLGASDVVAVEADPATYLRALVLKEVARLERTTLLLGDAAAYLRGTADRFDLVVALDVLHHQLEPTAFLEAMAGASDRLLLWTRCFDGERIDASPPLRARFTRPPVERDVRGRAVLVHRFAHDVHDPGLARGPDPLGGWLTRDDLLGSLDALGYDVSIPPEFDLADDPGGPSLLVAAHRP